MGVYIVKERNFQREDKARKCQAWNWRTYNGELDKNRKETIVVSRLVQALAFYLEKKISRLGM